MRLRRHLVWAAALATTAAACNFFNPLDQEGLSIVIVSRDTAVTPGGTVAIAALMRNRFNDEYPSSHINFATADPTIATIDPSGVASGTAIGRVRIRAFRDNLADSSWLSVVPTGQLAVSEIADVSHLLLYNTDGTGVDTLVSTGQVTGGAPSWLPGNAGIVYQYAVPGGAGSTQLFLTDLAGNTHVLRPYGSDPRASRDGVWIYFTKGTIWRIHPDGSGETQVTTTNNDAVADPSPDGQRLVFQRDAFPFTGIPQIALRNLATNAEQVLAPNGLTPRWSPDGTKIAFFLIGSNIGHEVIHVMNADGSNDHLVSMPGRNYSFRGLDWSPDGQWLLAKSDDTIDLINVATGLALPLGWSGAHWLASWRW